ncbi:host attachment family protein [Hyphobacterium sp. SN044]|uniref:baeRF12 domain-containing protein n=1 Tax=Hyphobacterium sp. SN044 TaxID=2912575 RepID=UPI001F354347|nr:host attachment family protein [Hyphobacterium sp. SN044]MCF8880407.1 host attachment family protein [Hyphobacterium sp. SN044]
MPGPDREMWIVVADGGKALIYRNNGFDDLPDLRLVDADDIHVPPNREIWSDKPGRMPDAGHGYSAMEQDDAHQREEARFLKDLGEALSDAAYKKKIDRLIVFAPDRALGILRDNLGHAEAITEHMVNVDVVNEPADKLTGRVKKLLA